MPDADTIHPDIFAPAIAVLLRAAEAAATEAHSCLHSVAIISD